MSRLYRLEPVISSIGVAVIASVAAYMLGSIMIDVQKAITGLPDLVARAGKLIGTILGRLIGTALNRAFPRPDSGTNTFRERLRTRVSSWFSKLRRWLLYRTPVSRRFRGLLTPASVCGSAASPNGSQRAPSRTRTGSR